VGLGIPAIVYGMRNGVSDYGESGRVGKGGKVQLNYGKYLLLDDEK